MLWSTTPVILPEKLVTQLTKPLDSQRDLALAYSPGVAEPCRVIADDVDASFQVTGRAI